MPMLSTRNDLSAYFPYTAASTKLTSAKKSKAEPTVHNVISLKDAVRAGCQLILLAEGEVNKIIFQAAKTRKASWAC